MPKDKITEAKISKTDKATADRVRAKIVAIMKKEYKTEKFYFSFIRDEGKQTRIAHMTNNLNVIDMVKIAEGLTDTIGKNVGK